MLFIKIHKSCRDVVAICDCELIGNYFEEGNLQLDLKESFYEGEKCNENKAKEIIRKMSAEDATFNIVGKEAIQYALDCGIILETGVKKIKDIPFAFVLM
jgi:uncharacterized protein